MVAKIGTVDMNSKPNLTVRFLVLLCVFIFLAAFLWVIYPAVFISRGILFGLWEIVFALVVFFWSFIGMFLVGLGWKFEGIRRNIDLSLVLVFASVFTVLVVLVGSAARWP
jgi:hypothetical protein